MSSGHFPIGTGKQTILLGVLDSAYGFIKHTKRQLYYWDWSNPIGASCNSVSTPG